MAFFLYDYLTINVPRSAFRVLRKVRLIRIQKRNFKNWTNYSRTHGN